MPWGSLSRAVGLDAVVLRDSVLLAGQYRRVGPYGPTAPSDPERAAARLAQQLGIAGVLAHFLQFQVFADGDKLHLRCDDVLTGIVHLTEIRVAALAPCCDPGLA